MTADLRSDFSRTIALLEQAVPGLRLNLGEPASESSLAKAEATLGYALPPDLRALYLVHDGQDRGSHGLFGGLPFLPLARALDEWGSWRGNDRSDQDSIYSPVPAGAVKESQADAGWFPFTVDGGGNCLAVDTVPGPLGNAGQVINFGRDERDLFAYSPSLLTFLQQIVAMASAGRAVVSDDDYPSWGTDDAESWSPVYENFIVSETPALSDAEWFETLDSQWKLYIGSQAKAADFARKTALYANPPLPQTTLAPLARATKLRDIHGVGWVLNSLHDLPVLPDLRELWVATLSNEGIDRFPKLRVYSPSFPADAVPAADFFAPLSTAPALTALTIGDRPYDLAPLGDCAKLKDVTIKLHSAAQFAQLAAVKKLSTLRLSAGAIPGLIDDLDWSAVPRLGELTIDTGRIASFGFTAHLQRLTMIDVQRFDPVADPVDVSAIAALPKIFDVRLTPASAFSGVEDFGNVATLAHFAAGFGAFDILRRLRTDLPFRSMSGELTAEQHDVWEKYVRGGS